MNWYKKSQNISGTAELEQIDGKWYDESLAEVNPPTEPPKERPAESVTESLQRKSYTVDSYGVTFTEGEEYTNWFGTYVVLKINDDATMDVEYLQSFKHPINAGDIKNYPMNSQAETIHKSRRSKEIEMKLNNIMDLKGQDGNFTMGLMAANGYISAEVGPKYHKSFPEKYKAITGEDVSKYLGAGYRLSPNEDRWSYTLRVHLPSLPPEILNKLNVKNIISRKDGIEINDNAFVWGLLNNGFSIGRNKDKIAQMVSKLTDEDKGAFLAGTQIL